MKQTLLLFACAAALQANAQWVKQTSNTTSHLYGIHFISPDTGFAVGGEVGMDAVILKTTNGGQAWTNVYTGVQNEKIKNITFINKTKGFAVGEKSSAPLIKVTN